MIGDGIKALAKLKGSMDIGEEHGDKTDVSVYLSSPLGSATLEMRVPTEIVGELDLVSAVYGAEKTYREFGGKNTGQAFLEHSLADERMLIPSVQAINQAVRQGKQNGAALREVLTEDEVDAAFRFLDKDSLDESFINKVFLIASVDPELDKAIEKVGSSRPFVESQAESLDEMMSAKEVECDSIVQEQREREAAARKIGKESAEKGAEKPVRADVSGPER